MCRFVWLLLEVSQLRLSGEALNSVRGRFPDHRTRKQRNPAQLARTCLAFFAPAYDTSLVNGQNRSNKLPLPMSYCVNAVLSTASQCHILCRKRCSRNSRVSRRQRLRSTRNCAIGASACVMHLPEGYHRGCTMEGRLFICSYFCSMSHSVPACSWPSGWRTGKTWMQSRSG